MKTFFLLAVTLITTTIWSQVPSLEWGLTTGSINSDDLVNEINLTPQNNLLITGQSFETIDLDFGSGLSEVGALGAGCTYFAEYDTSGNLNWVVELADFPGYVYDLELDPAGNIYVIGNALSANNNLPDTADFDPGPGIFELEIQQLSQFLLKLDASGNFIDARILASSSTTGDQMRSESIKLDDNQNIYVGGMIVGDIDVNPGGAPNIMSTGGIKDGFVEKFDSNGNLLWFNQYDESWVYTLQLDDNSELLVGGYFKDSMDFDFGPGIDMQYEFALDSTTSFIQKLDPLGNSLWSEAFSHGTQNHVTDFAIADNGDIFSTSIGGLFLNGGKLTIQRYNSGGNKIWERSVGYLHDFRSTHGVQLDSLDNVYIGGRYLGDVDFDPNPFSAHLDTSDAGIGFFLLKLSSNGDFVWQFDIASFSGNIGLQSLFQLDDDNNLYFYNTYRYIIDIEPGPGVTDLTAGFGVTDIYLIKYAQGPCANIYTEVDTAYNVSCGAPGWISTNTYAGTAPFSYFWNSTPTSDSANVVAVDGGLYELQVTDALGCTTERAVLIDAPATQSDYDLTVNTISNNFVVGQSTHFWIDAFNDGCVPQNGEIMFVLPDVISGILSITPPPDQTVGDTLYWDFPTSVYGDPHYQIHIHALIDTLAAPGDSSCFTTTILPVAADFDPLNNYNDACEDVVASYDPNFKEVSPYGECAERFVLTDETLKYTVHFQNTGTYQAFDIRVRDNLDPNLDLSSVRVLAQSHPMFMDIQSNNTIDFRFDNINLPDSASNEAESHGWFVFEVDPLPGLPNNTLVDNSVEIYFDYNLPVVTDTVFNTYIDNIDCFLGLEQLEEDSFLVYPNPSNGMFTIDFGKEVSNVDLRVYSIEGKEVVNVEGVSGAKIELDMTDKPNGIYWINIIGDVNSGRKLVIR